MLTTANKKAILTILQEDGENGIVRKADLSQEQITTLTGFAGEELDCNFDFTRTQKTGEQDDKGVDITEEIIEKMYCNNFIETSDAFMTDRDALSNYSGSEVDEEGNNILEALEAKTTITI